MHPGRQSGKSGLSLSSERCDRWQERRPGHALQRSLQAKAV